jgi:hypothetical protein
MLLVLSCLVSVLPFQRDESIVRIWSLVETPVIGQTKLLANRTFSVARYRMFTRTWYARTNEFNSLVLAGKDQ